MKIEPLIDAIKTTVTDKTEFFEAPPAADLTI